MRAGLEFFQSPLIAVEDVIRALGDTRPLEREPPPEPLVRGNGPHGVGLSLARTKVVRLEGAVEAEVTPQPGRVIVKPL